MKSRKHAKTNRRKFRATKSKVYRKSRRNVRKIMRGGNATQIRDSTELDNFEKTVYGENITHEAIQIVKTGNKSDLLNFLMNESVTKIPLTYKTSQETYNPDIKKIIISWDNRNNVYSEEHYINLVQLILPLAKKLLNEEKEITTDKKTVKVNIR